MADPVSMNTEELCNEFLDALKLLKEAAILFRTYEKNHRAKVKPVPIDIFFQQAIISSNEDTLAKAEVNAEIAARIEKFIDREMTSVDREQFTHLTENIEG